MKYMGSKSRIAKYILPVILESRKENQYYVEPFVGGCNSIDKVKGNRMAGDLNSYLIAMWKGLQQYKDYPQEISKATYDLYRDLYNIKDPNSEFMIGFVGFAASFNGRFYDGGYSGKSGGRDYVREQIRNIERQIPNIMGVEFYSCDYSDLPIPDESIIYCDIPYQGTKAYDVSRSFDYPRFWQWCREMSDKGHRVFISELEAPPDFKCVWEMETINSLNSTKTYKKIEKLFTV